MKPGDVVLIRLPQIGGGPLKLPPAIILASLPGPYQSLLICGVSTQMQKQTPGWDELVQHGDPDFAGSSFHQDSVIRLSYLYSAEPNEIAGFLGCIDESRLHRLLTRLAEHLHR